MSLSKLSTSSASSRAGAGSCGGGKRGLGNRGAREPAPAHDRAAHPGTRTGTCAHKLPSPFSVSLHLSFPSAPVSALPFSRLLLVCSLSPS